MKIRISIKDLFVISITCSMMVVIGTMQILFFKNPSTNFDPNVLTYIYCAFGIVSWFALKSTRAMSKNAITYILILARMAVILIQVICFIAGPLYNEANEVAYYDMLSRVLVDPLYLNPYQSVKYGITPGFQFFLFTYRFMLFQHVSGFAREIVFFIINACFETVTVVIMVNIASHPSFSSMSGVESTERSPLFQKGMLFYSISIFNIYYSNVRGFIDALPVFIGVAGLYYFMINKHIVASLLLSISILIKFISIFWLLIIILKFLKEKKFKIVLSYTVVAALTAAGFFLACASIFQENPFTYFLEFFPQFYDWSILSGDGIQLNQSLWYPLYNSTFFMIGLGILAFVSFTLVFKGKKGFSFHSFTTVTCMYIIFQPWYDQRYVLWVLPLLCLDLQGSRKMFSRFVTLFFISIFIYLFFMHVVLDLGIDTRFGYDVLNVGLTYRLTGQMFSYVALALVCVHHFKETFNISAKLPFSKMVHASRNGEEL